jgi:hypothetical protein
MTCERLAMPYMLPKPAILCAHPVPQDALYSSTRPLTNPPDHRHRPTRHVS